MSPMHKKVAAASNLLTEWASALRRTIVQPPPASSSATPSATTAAQQSSPLNRKATSAKSTGAATENADVEQGPFHQGPEPKKEDKPPDIHPELTLAQIRQHREEVTTSGHQVKKKDLAETKLEINTMFDFHTSSTLKTSTKSSIKRNKTRRSSVAVMTASEAMRGSSRNPKDYFENHHLNLHSTTLNSSQSNSAVHYLAISPPRIRITDDNGSDLFGKMTSASVDKPILEEEAENDIMEEDEIGELISRKTDRRTSNSSTTSSSASSSVNLTRGSSVESRRSSAAGGCCAGNGQVGGAGTWSHRSRFI